MKQNPDGLEKPRIEEEGGSWEPHYQRGSPTRENNRSPSLSGYRLDVWSFGSQPFAVQYLAFKVRPDGACVISYWGLSYQCLSLTIRKLGILKKPFGSKKLGCCSLAWDESYTLELSRFPMLTWYFPMVFPASWTWSRMYTMVFHG